MATDNFSIPELAAAQAQKHVTVNEALRVVDTAMNLTVIRADFTAPPGTPSEGDKYIPAATASGAWTGKENQVAAYINATWVFFVPDEGWRAYDQDQDVLLIFDGSTWGSFSASILSGGPNGTAAAPSFSFGSDPDTGMYRNAANQLGFATGGSQRLLVTNTQITATSAQFLLTDQGSDANFTISKQAVGDDAVLTLQTNFSTRALFGLQANDDLTLKVSPNGSSFTDALVLDKDNGRATFGERVHGAAGSAALPAFSFSVDTDMGMYRNAGNQLGFATGGSQRLLIGNSQVAISTGDLLVNNAGGSATTTVNKDAAGDDAGFTFQTAFSTVAQLGALGNDDFSIKVGGSFTTALTIDSSTAAVDLPTHPKFSGYVNLDVYVAANTWTKVGINNARHNDQSALNTSTNVFTAPHDGYYSFGAGYTFKANATVPEEIRVGLSVNGATPTEDQAITFADSYDFTVSLKTSVQVTGLLKLSAGDTVEMQAYMGANDGYVEADSNHFWGAQIA